jgi:opacity protein-like surface antigen
MKTTLKLSVAFLALTSQTHATWQPYIGLGFGLAKSQNSMKADYSSVMTTDSQTLNMDTTGTSGSLILGIRQQQKSFFIGGEVFTTIHQFNTKRKGTAFYNKNPYMVAIFLDFEVAQKHSNGVSFLFGKDITSNMDVFVKFDFFVSKFAIKYANSEMPSNQSQHNKWLFGYAPGVGILIKLTENISTRFDYTYRIYNEFRSKNLSRETDIAQTNIRGSILPRNHQFALALIYKF